MISRLFARLSAKLLFALLITGALHGQTFHNFFDTKFFGESTAFSLDALVQLFTLASLAAAILKYGHNPRRGWWIGFVFSFAWFVNGAGWVYVSMHQYGGMAAPLAAAAAGLFAGYLALFTGLACAAICAKPLSRLWANTRGLGFVALFAASITLAELARGYLMTGFPWAAIGYAHADSPLRFLAPLVGVYGIGFAAAAMAAALAFAMAGSALAKQSKLFIRWPIFIVIAALTFALPQFTKQPFTTEKPAIQASLIQPAIEQSMKFRSEKIDENFETVTKALLSAPASLVILPETVWPRLFEATSAPVFKVLQTQIEQGKTIVLGIPLVERSGENNERISVSNSAVVLHKLDDIGSIDSPSVRSAYRYDKHHLVPFGEFIPWGFDWFVKLMNMPLGNMKRGTSERSSYAYTVGSTTVRLGLNICYEDLFGEEIATRAHDADILVNISNLAWFGQSKAIAQHLQIARMRTLETQRPTLRATNTGATVHINAFGKVEHFLAQDQLGVLTVAVTGRTGLTPYMRYGNWPIALLALIVLLAAGLIALLPRR
jgi:apolipoprotein N-acyltransferase